MSNTYYNASKAVLVLVYNHKYEKNIDILEKIYEKRFRSIYHLVPFYKGNKSNVIAVYENSFYFQGYFAQACNYFFNAVYDHYLFVADDLLLNPGINENNYQEYFNLTPAKGFIPEIFDLNHLTNNETLYFQTYRTYSKKRFYWWRIKDIINYKHKREGVEHKNEMPGFDDALSILKKHGYYGGKLTYHDLYGGLFPISLATHEKRQEFKRFVFNLKNYTKKYDLDYPLVGAYSDIVIVPQHSVKTFCHYCGIFAANELFVEFAIPTALLLSCSDVITEPSINKRGSIYWTYTKEDANLYDKEMNTYDYQLANLLLNFPTDKLYIHPVKLSRWDTDELDHLN